MIGTSLLRFATSWQRVRCEPCGEDTNHYRNRCVHCGAVVGVNLPQTVAQYNGREMASRLTDEQRTEARRLLNAGTPPKLIAAKMHVTPSTIYRLNPLTRG